MFSEEQAEAWKSDEMFRLLVSGAKDYAIILLDDTGHVVRWNDGAERIQGFKAEEIIGSHCSQFYTEEDVKAGKPEVELRLARIAGRFQDEGWRVRKDKSRFWASFELTALRDKEGTLTGFGKVVRDITARKNAEERLRKSEEMFRLLVLGVKDYAIVMLNPDGEVASWNEGAERITGYSADQILGINYSRFYTKEDIDQDKPNEELQVAAREGRLEVEGWRVRKDQSRFRAHVVLAAVHDDQEKLVGFCKVTRDITLQKETEDALKAAKEQAEQASRFKSEFLANMSHEIRTPMNGIIGITNILLRSPLVEQQHQNLTILRDVGVSLLSVINDILDFSKVEAGKLQLESADFEPAALIEGIGDFFAAQARGANVSLATYIAPDVPRFMCGDAGRLRQILTNLTSNAIKFSPNGEVVIRAGVEHVNGASTTLRFAVIDTGVGVAQEAIERIFSPFVQADGATNRKYGGTGLGLSISKRLVELMGGEIGVTSRLGHGANFWFTVPLEMSAANIEDDLAAVDFNELSVLVVDDVPSSRKIIEDYLSEWGAKFTSAASVPEALNLVRIGCQEKNLFSLVLINLSSPFGHLVSFASELIELCKTARTEIVLAYGLGDSQNEQSLIDQYFRSRISKPIKRSELLTCLGNLLNREGDIHQSVRISLSVEKRRQPGEFLDRLKKVLVVEDNQVNKRVILMELEELGLRAEAVGNGVEALKALAENCYDIILMDCQMPEMDGFEATKLIRKQEQSQGGHIPIIAMTAQALDGDREKCLSAGMDDYLAKPIDFTLLERSLQRFIPNAQALAQVMSGSQSRLTIGAEQRASLKPREPLVDFDYLKGKYTAKRLQELVELFVDSSKQIIVRLEEAVAQSDAAGLRSTAHELSGSCMMLRMNAMLQEARSLEQLAQNPDWKEVQKHFGKLEDCFRATQEMLLTVSKQ
jgi:polar amino acid transport system substrate-binding protein